MDTKAYANTISLIYDDANGNAIGYRHTHGNTVTIGYFYSFTDSLALANPEKPARISRNVGRRSGEERRDAGRIHEGPLE